MGEVFRVEPAGPVQAYQTFESRRPAATHFRPASCAEVECAAHVHGWRTVIDVATDLGARQANYIRLHSGRSYSVVEEGTLVTFLFPPGQECFAQHQVPVDRPALYLVRRGDWRGNLGLIRRHTSVESWFDNLHEETERVARAIEKG